MNYLALLLIACVLGGCTNRALIDYDQTANFLALQTYAWADLTYPPNSDPSIHNSLIDNRVISAVDLNLQLRGYKLVDPLEADFYVSFELTMKERIEGSSVYTGIGNRGYGFGWGFGVQQTLNEYEQVTLFLNIINPENQQLFWQGSIHERLSTLQTEPGRSQLRMNELIKSLLDKFPPS